MSLAHPADEQTASELHALEERRITGLLAVDIEALEPLFDDELVHIHAPGVVQTKTQLLEHIATRQAYLSITRGDLGIRMIGADVALITGSISNRLRSANGIHRTVEGVVSQVAGRGADGRWRFVSFQMTPYGEQAWPALPSQQEETQP